MLNQYEVDTIVKGIELSWTTWGKMRGEKLVLDDISYLKAENSKGFERIFSIKIEENQDFRIQQMISFIKAGIMPDSMLIMPETKPSNLAEILSHKGFAINDSDPCMMMYLGDYIETRAELSNFLVSDVTGAMQLGDWLSIVNEALFGGELVTLEQFNDILNLDNTYFYLGLLYGKPVTVCMTIAEGDTSVLEMVATLGDYRRQGFASAAINKALIDLRQKGVKTISLRAEANGVGVYKRLGFKECFKRVVASCDWKAVHKEACPCRMENEKIIQAKQIFIECKNIGAFVAEMNRQAVIGRNIWYEPQEDAVYITKMHACDCGGGCLSNDSAIGRICHCIYVNHLTEHIPISYCKCAAFFFEPLFISLFGENVKIEPVQTVLSGADACTFGITF